MGLNDIVKASLLYELPLLHKLHKKEVFLSSCISFNSEYKASPFLHKHHCFCNHINTLTDTMFILECARQIETYIVHKYEYQPLDTKFILTEWSCKFSETFIPTVDLLNHSVMFNVTTDNSRYVKDRLLSPTYQVNANLENAFIAMSYMSVKYMSDYAYHKIRNKINNIIAAAGAVETVLTILSVKYGIIPPTVNLTSVDPEINLDIVFGELRELKILHALKLSMGFGGHNGALIISSNVQV